MASLTDGWAGGRCGLYRYGAGSWARWADGSFDASAVSDLDVVSRDEAWAVGFSDTHCGGPGPFPIPIIWHYSNEQWESITPTAGAGRLYAVRALGPSDVWAVGEWVGPGGEQAGALALHYQGERWEFAVFPSALPLRAVDALTEDSVWVGGDDGFFQYTPATGWRKRGLAFPVYDVNASGS